MEDKIQQLEQRVKKLEQQRVSQQQIGNLQVKQRHIDGVIIFRGDAADRPSTGDTEIQAFYAEDTKTLSIWNRTNEAWEVEVLT